MRSEKRQRGATSWLYGTLTLCLTLLVIEVCAAFTTAMLARRGWIVSVPDVSEREFSRYLRVRNPLLGWGPAVGSAGKVVTLMPRHGSARALSDSSCIAAYGDSFTFGGDVASNETYPYFLERTVGCPVGNYGTMGYGSDQALMLLNAQRHLDRAPIVILGHLTENILRNVNRDRSLLYPGSHLQFKPRFVIAKGRLGYVPIPVNSIDDYRALKDDPERVLSGDAFLRRPRREFPYTLSLVRWLTGDIKVRAALSGVPPEAAFYAPRHFAGGLPLTSSILTAFAQGAAEQGRHGVVLLIPTVKALTYAEETGRWVDQPLVDALKSSGVPVIHAGPKILDRLSGRDPCLLFNRCKQPHFSADGNRLLAVIVAEELGRMGLVSR